MKKMKCSQILSKLLALAACVLALTVALYLVIASPALAEPPDQRPSRYSFRPSSKPRRFRSVLGLHRTARYPIPPAGPIYKTFHGPYPCYDAVIAAGTEPEFWIVKPSPHPVTETDINASGIDDIDIFLEDPYDWPGVVVWICGGAGDQDTTYELTGPVEGNETTIPLTPTIAIGAGDDALPYAYDYEFLDACEEGQEPPDCSLPGTYRLTIKSGSDEYVAGSFRVEVYDGPRIEAQESQSSDTDPALDIQYLDFDEGEGPIRVCLYNGQKGSVEETFVDDWEVAPDSNGVFSDELTVTEDMTEGEYTLVGVQGEASAGVEPIPCPPVLDDLTMAYLAGQEPPAAHWRFGLYADEPEPDESVIEALDTEEPDKEGPDSDYFDLGWAPGCDRDRPLALQLPGQGGCGPEVARQDMEWLTDQLREQGLLEADEWLEVVTLRLWRREALAIQGEAGSELGWIRIGGSVPGSVWRTTYHPPGEQVGERCWLGTDFVWECQE